MKCLLGRDMSEEMDINQLHNTFKRFIIWTPVFGVSDKAILMHVPVPSATETS